MIKDIKITQILNSKGKPTIKIKIYTEKGIYSASVPSGTSKGVHEAIEISVSKVLKDFPKIKKKFIGLEEKENIDNLLEKIDGTKKFSKIGGNLALAISVAFARAKTSGELWKLNGLKKIYKFPFPLGNVIGGGAHGGGSDFQEFLILPWKAKNPKEAVETNLKVYNLIGKELKKRNLLIGKNFENAWKTKLNDLETLEFLSKITEDFELKIGIDFAASNFWNGKFYNYKKLGKTLSPGEQIDFIKEIKEKYNLYYLEDPFQEEDFKSFSELRKKVKNCLIVGDDLICTNPERIKRGIKSINGVIIKPNQIGNLSLAKKVVDIAKKNKIVPIISHRSGETLDNWIADLAIAWETPIIKTGAYGKERLSKLNRLIEIWNEVKNKKMNELIFKTF